ncbi:MAG: DUF4249 domain-containing protein [Prolixibacteraceae bacterium]|nr:DUF4249 domain-containing protein [Prolixibacteraceae bacterium]
MKKSLFILFISVLLCSCVETFELESIPVNKTLVVNSFINPDSVFSCTVSHTFALNDTLSHVLEDATVRIIEDATNELVCSLQHCGQGNYRAESKFPETEKVYRLEVKAAGYPDVSATTSIPVKQLAEDIYALLNVGIDALSHSHYSELHFSLTDNNPEDNYFMFRQYSVRYVDYDYNQITFEKIPLNDTILLVGDAGGYADNTIVDAVIQNEGIMKFSPSFLYFSDELFNLQKHDFTIRLSLGGGKYSIFTLYTLSPDFYRYQLSLMQQLYENGQKQLSRYDDFAVFNFYNSAVSLYSNIKGGYGIFAGYNSHKKYAPNVKPIYIIYDEFGHCNPGRENIIRFEYDTIPPYFELPPPPPECYE